MMQLLTAHELTQRRQLPNKWQKIAVRTNLHFSRAMNESGLQNLGADDKIKLQG
jgi:hypothetical protein